MDRKALVYSGVLLLSLVIVSVLLSRGRLQAIHSEAHIDLFTTSTTSTVGAPRTFNITTTFADLDTITISGVQLILYNSSTGTTTLDVLLPVTSTTSTTLDLSVLSPEVFAYSTGTAVVTTVFNNVIDFETTTLLGGTLGANATSSGKFKGIFTGATIGFTVVWTSPNSAAFVGSYTATVKVHVRNMSGTGAVYEKSVDFAIESGVVTQTIPLAAGLNFITFAVELPAGFKFVDLAQAIDAVGGAGTVFRIYSWNSTFGRWDAFNPAQSFINNLDVTLGRGYFISVTQATTHEQVGNSIASPVIRST